MEGLTRPEAGYMHCTFRDCSWRTVDRSHLGWVVVGGPAADSSGVDLKRVPALEQMHGELLEHLRTQHLQELQLMVAGASGGRGEPVDTSLVQHIDARAVQDAGDVVAGVLVPQMRARMARDLATRKLRPVDPWPAVQVRRFVWTSAQEYAAAMNGDGSHPPGMRELQEWEREEGRTPDLWQLELRTLAVPDTRAALEL